MKRARSETPSDMSPGVVNEDYFDAVSHNGALTPGLAAEDDVSHVTVVGAGPAGLMLAYVS
jgi:NADPH-dependent 2,4-dienoyl-CoA reductase/sulfur reductase-like enzyme